MAIDDELLAALAEGRLTEGERDALVLAVAQDGEARAAFRDLFPERYEELFCERGAPLRTSGEARG